MPKPKPIVTPDEVKGKGELVLKAKKVAKPQPSAKAKKAASAPKKAKPVAKKPSAPKKPRSTSPRTLEARERLREEKQLEQLQTSFTPARKLTRTEMRALKVRNKKPHGTRDLVNSEGNIIDVRRVWKTYVSGSSTYDALRDVSFTIKRGEFVVILGASGSGKTTLLNLLSGLDRTTQGEVVINNLNIAAFSNRELTTFRRHSVGFVFQSYNLLPELNAKDNAELGRALQLDRAQRRDLFALFNDMGMQEKMRAPVAELSGGQQQRVAIARALAKRPSLIFADEPTGALDSHTSERVLALFKDISAQYQTTVVIVTHDEQIAKLAQKIIRVKDGVVQVDV